MIPKIRIEQDGAAVTHISLDGKEVKGVKKFSVERDVMDSDIPVLKLEVYCPDMTLEFPGVPALPDVFKPYYERKKEAAPADAKAADANE